MTTHKADVRQLRVRQSHPGRRPRRRPTSSRRVWRAVTTSPRWRKRVDRHQAERRSRQGRRPRLRRAAVATSPSSATRSCASPWVTWARRCRRSSASTSSRSRTRPPTYEQLRPQVDQQLAGQTQQRGQSALDTGSRPRSRTRRSRSTRRYGTFVGGSRPRRGCRADAGSEAELAADHHQPPP